MTRAEKDCADMGPGFRNLVRTLRLQYQREQAEQRALAKKLTLASQPKPGPGSVVDPSLEGAQNHPNEPGKE